MTVWTSPELLTIPGLLRAGAERVPDKTALHIEDEPITYADLLDRSLAAAGGLHHLGIRSGDSVGALSPNSPEMLYTMLGCAFLGAVFVPINADYKGEFIRHQLATSEAKVVLVDAELLAELAPVVPALPALEHVVVPQRDPSASTVLGGGSGVVIHSAADILSGDKPLPDGHEDPAGEAIAAVIFTAGTTGPSKGVAMSHNYLCRSARQVFELRGGTEDSVVYGALPMFHLAAISLIILGPLSHFATGALDNRFSPNRFWERVRRVNADHTVMLGAMSAMLWARPEADDDADNPIKVALIAPMPPAIHKAFEERFGLTVLQLYAQSEAYPLTVASADAPAPPGYSGKPNPMFTVKLFDADDREVPVGEVGEVVVRPNGPSVLFSGYYKNPQATVDVWRNGWMHTGDLGRFDEDGYFEFVDRKKDYLRRRGENISSFEVERTALMFDPVAEAAVIAAPSELTEDDVVACLVIKPGAAFDERAFLDHCAANMPYFAVPRYVWVLEDLPRNPVGRVEKYKLRERLNSEDRSSVEGLWDREAVGYVVARGRGSRA